MYLSQPPFINGDAYHIFNRGIDRRPIFTDRREYRRALQSLSFYTSTDTSLRLSHYLTLSQEDQQIVGIRRQESPPRVSVLAYCLMPNHFHMLVRQEVDNGISEYLSHLQNSYARYFNARHQRAGSLFEGVFKAVRIESQSQLTHVSRYIHLNPYVARLEQDLAKIPTYPWSSLQYYATPTPRSFINTQIILESFPSPDAYLDFTLDYVNHQNSLTHFDHLELE